MIRTASVNDKAALLDIWSAAFGDSADYAEFAVSNCLSLGTVLYHPEGKSCLTLFPLSLHRKGKSPLNGAYMYGVATHPEQQKKATAPCCYTIRPSWQNFWFCTLLRIRYVLFTLKEVLMFLFLFLPL